MPGTVYLPYRRLDSTLLSDADPHPNPKTGRDHVGVKYLSVGADRCTTAMEVRQQAVRGDSSGPPA